MAIHSSNIIVIGAGGHAAELDEYINFPFPRPFKEPLQVVGFLDDNPGNYDTYQFSAPLLGPVKDHAVRPDCRYLMGIANLRYRRPLIEKFLAAGAVFATLIHPSAYVSPSAEVGRGTVVGPHVNIGPNVRVGDFNLLNARCSIGHDTLIGNYNFICPNVCFSGFSQVGDDNLFGINSATIPEIKIGNDNKIAAGMTIGRNVGNDAVVFYRFKEKITVVKK